MKKKFFIFTLLALSMTAGFAFGACSETPSDTGNSSTSSDSTASGSASSDSTSEGNSEAPPDEEYTAVTYVFTNDEGVSLTYDETVEVGTTLSYTLETVEYTDTWYSDSECTQAVSVAAGESMTVYTSFTDIYIDYVLRSNGKTVGMDTITLRDGEISLPEPNAVEGHTFQGWKWSDETYAAGEKLSIAVVPDDYFAEIEAVWTANSYSVRYVSEGSETKEVTQTFGSAVQAPDARTGYTFLGWYEKDNASPITTITKDVELEAKWEAFSYALRFSLGGYEGEGSWTDGTYEYGETVALPDLERKGYSFLGWFVSVDGAEAVKTTVNSYTIGLDLDAESIFFEAKFEAKSRNVTVYLDNGETAQVTLKTGEKLADALSGLIGERFSGWFYDEETLKGVGVNDVLPAIGDEETFCVYGAYDKTYNITFVIDGVSETKQLLFGEDIVVAPEKTGHDFLGWFTQQEGGDKIVQVPAGDQTLYAQFELKTLNVTYDLNGGNGSVANAEEKYGNEVNLAAGEGITKTYFIFGGWTDGETVYEAGETITLTDNLNLSAVWDSYDVTLELTDWDGTVILSGVFDSGTPLTLPTDSVWTKVDEFEGFYYEDIYGNEYYLREGDLLGQDVTAGAFYLNRRTNEKLVFPSVDSFAFYQRTDGSYWISGRKGVYDATKQVLDAEQFFIAEALPRDYLCLPATYQGGLVYGVVDSDQWSRGAFSIYAASSFDYDGTAYQVTGHLYIPSCYQELGDYAFSSQQASIVEFGRDSQMKRFGLRSDILMNITAIYGFPQNLRQIENYALGSSNNSYKFYYQDGSEVTTFPTSIRYLGSDVFRGVDIFTEVDLSNVISCGGGVFAYCTKIESVIFGGLSAIPSTIFYGCTGLKEVVIPANVTQIRVGAFQESGLETVTFAEDSNLKTIEQTAFYHTKLTEISIPDSVTTIGNSAFAGLTDVDHTNESYLQKVKLSASLETVGNFAFAGVHCTEIILPENLKTVGEYAFYGTQNWKNVVLPNSLVTVQKSAFMKAPGYTYADDDKFVLKIGDNVEFIGVSAFRQIKNVCGIEFSNSGKLKEIKSYAFADMPALEGADIVFPEGLESLETCIFSYMKESSYNIPMDEGAKIKSVTLPSTLTWLGGYAFAYNNALVSVTFADNQNALGGEDTDGDGVLERSEMTNYLTIGNGAFAHCTALESIELPCHLFRIAGGVSGTKNGIFWGCSSLKEVVFRGRDSGVDDALDISSVTFSGCTALKTIKIDRNSEATLFISWSEYDKTVFMEDCSGVTLWVRAAYQSYYNDATTFWGECQPTRIRRVRTL